MLFSVIIVNYNLSDEIVSCINSIIKNAENSEIEIIVVDNASTEPGTKTISEKIIESDKIKIEYFYLDKNYGFGFANNYGFSKSKGDIIVLLNPDTIILNNIFSFVENLFRENIDISVVGPKIINEKGKVEKSFGQFPNLFLEFLNIFMLARFYEKLILNFKLKKSGKNILDVDWVTGAGMFIRRSVYEKVKGFDSNFFLYSEEIDLCKRIKDQMGKIKYCIEIEIVHSGSLSSKKNYYFFTKTSYESKIYFIKKHFSGFKRNLIYVFLLMHIIIQIIFWGFFYYSNQTKASGKLKIFPKLAYKILTEIIV